MNKKIELKGFKYIPKIWSSVFYFLGLGFAFLLFMGRKPKWSLDFITNLFPGFYSHISNFSISFMIVLVAGYMGVLQSGKLKPSIIIAAVGIITNLLYEFFIPVLNTPDAIDALFGVAGCILPFVYLLVYQKWGIKPNPIHQ